MKERYFGSVRFFKNLILLAVIVAVAVPTGFLIHLSGTVDRLKETITSQAEEAAPDETADPVSPTRAELGDGTFSLSDLVLNVAPTALADTPTYTSLYPDFYAQSTPTADQSVEKTAFLTFDDGPSDRTDEILNILAEKDVKATFFAIGRTDEANLQRMKKVVAAGHTLGMHSYTHDYAKIYASVEAYLDDMYQIFTLIRDTTGVAPSVFRLPGGSINGYDFGIYQQILAEMLRRGFVPCDWNVSSEDATGGNVSTVEMIQNVVGGAKNDRRAFVLMHDAADKHTTVAALPGMIDGLRAEGYTLQALTPDVKPVLFGYTD